MAPNFANPPFNDVRLRQAIPYEKIMPGALFGRITPIWGGPQKIDTVGWPVPSHYSYKLDKAKALVAAATGGAAPEPLYLFGIPVDFILFGLTLLGVALFHHHTLPVALTGVAAIALYKIVFTGFKFGNDLRKFVSSSLII